MQQPHSQRPKKPRGRWECITALIWVGVELWLDWIRNGILLVLALRKGMGMVTGVVKVTGQDRSRIRFRLRLRLMHCWRRLCRRRRRRLWGRFLRILVCPPIYAPAYENISYVKGTDTDK